MSKCDNCLNSRSIMSENGLHRVCGLRDEYEAVDCLTGKKDMRVTIEPEMPNDTKVN